MFMGRTGAKPTAGSGGAVFLTAGWSTVALMEVEGLVLGTCAAGFAVATCAAAKATVATSANAAMPSRIVKGLPSVFMAANLTSLAAILAPSK